MDGMRLFELAGADKRRLFSPYCWRARMALAMKGLAAETIPWRFVQKDAIAPHGSEKVPVLLHGDRAVPDSWAIAEYLEENFPDRPSLFGGTPGRELARFVNGWTDAVLNAGLAGMIVSDIVKVLDEGDVAYFRASREARYGAPLDAVTAGREQRVEAFRAALHPLRMVLRGQPFLCGERPMYADAIVFGSFQWARCTSPFRPLAEGDAIEAWRQRMLGLHDGMARKVPAFYD